MTLNRILQPRWARAAAAMLIAFVFVWVLYGTLSNGYYDYYFYPRVKEGYIYPEWRYFFYDLGTIVWGVVGILASSLLLRSAILRLDVCGWTRRSVVAFFSIFAVLLFLGIVVGPLLRSAGLV